METHDTPHLAPDTAREVAGAAERPFGPAAAVVLATGIGAFVLGLFTTLSAASETMNDFLRFDEDVGPLSGKTIFGAGAFFVSWAILYGLWREKNPVARTVFLLAAVLVVLGLVGTFPIFFEAFADE